MQKSYTILVITAFFALISLSAKAQNNSEMGRDEIPESVTQLTDERIEFNREQKTYQGYKIQIFYGSEKNCYEQRDEFEEMFPDIPTSVIFSTPQWKLQVGQYLTRLDADKAIVEIKKEYPAAIVLSTEIEYD